MLSQNINEKRQKYTDLKIEIQKMRNIRAVVVPLVIGSLGSIPTCLATSSTEL